MSGRKTDRFMLHVLGTPDLRAPDGRRLTSILAQPKRLSLLTHLALSPAPVSRASLVALFWPESDETHARNALSQAVHHLRRALGDEVVQGTEGDRLGVPPEHLWCDARELLTDARPAEAVLQAADGDLLEGWNADDSQPLQEWLDAQRRKLHERAARLAPTADQKASHPIRAAVLDHEPRVVPWLDRLLAALTSKRAHEKGATRGLAAAMMTAGVIGLLGVAVGGFALAATRLGNASVQEMAVLMPRVISAPGAADLSPESVLDEVLAHLPSHADLRVVPIPSAASPPDLRTQLAAIGTREEDLPDWILEVSIRVTNSEVRVIGLMHRGASFELPGREGFGVPYDGGESALIEVPREVGEGVAAMVDRVLAGNGAGSR